MRSADPVSVEEVAHLTLSVDRLLLASGADTAQVQDSMTRFAGGFGCEAHLVVGYETLLLTVVVCGVASHTLRTLCLHLGIDIVTGTLLGALVVGFLAQGFARHFRAPAVAFAFPGVVAMVPGAFAFRAVIGFLQIVQTGAAAATALMTETLALAVTCVLMVAAIAVGIIAPLILVRKGTTL
jgi:uncharacterized membrane protein YjjB (DUF3815 family)